MILKLPNPYKEFYIYTYACGEGLGGILMQEGFVIAYESHKLKYHGKNYTTHNLKVGSHSPCPQGVVTLPLSSIHHGEITSSWAKILIYLSHLECQIMKVDRILGGVWPWNRIHQG